MTISFSDYADHDALGMAQLVRDGEISALDLSEVAWAAIDRVNPALNFLVAETRRYAEKQFDEGLPNGCFHGVPFLRKDIPSAMRGIPSDMGCEFAAGFSSNELDNLTRRMLETGLVIVGRSTAPSMSASITTECIHGGPTRNPWNLLHSPAGSSGGSASAVASGAVPIALAGDMGGSTRLPAHATGTFGFKPSRNLAPVGPAIGELAYGFSVAGVITRSVRDTAAMMDAVAGPDAGCTYYTPPPDMAFMDVIESAPPRNLRIAVNMEPIAHRSVDPACRTAVFEAAEFLQRSGHIIEEHTVPTSSEDFVDAVLTATTATVAARVESIARMTGREPTAASLESSIYAKYVRGKNHSALDIIRALDRINTLAREYGLMFEEWDLILEPVSQSLAPRIGDIPGHRDGITAEEYFDASLPYMGFSIRVNALGIPAVAIPWNIAPNGLPCSVQLVARLGHDALCLQIARLFEREHPWRDRRPPIHICSEPAQ